MLFNADLPAEFEDRAIRAARQRARADMFAEWNEQTVDLDPVTSRKFAFERDSGLLRLARPDISPAIGNAMYVYVNGDARLTAGDSERKVRAFRTDAFE
jgi:hypothetical protein